MKLKRVITRGAVQTQQFRNSFDDSRDELVFDATAQCIIVNNATYIPLSSVLEFVPMPQPKPLKQPITK